MGNEKRTNWREKKRQISMIIKPSNYYWFLLISLHLNVADSTAPATVDRNAENKSFSNEFAFELK